MKLTETDFSEFATYTFDPGKETDAWPEGVSGVVRRLEEHVREFLEGGPWMPFCHTLGISGQETYFDHPDQECYALSLVLPYLGEALAGRVRVHLRRLVADHPPYRVEGYEPRQGRSRESYDLPMALRRVERRRAVDLFGVYSMWLYGHVTGDTSIVAEHWPALRQRVEQWMRDPYRFDPEVGDYERDEAEVLNRNVAGLLGAVRLAEALGASDWARRAEERGRALLEWRTNLDRMNPHLVRPTHHATKALHQAKVPRYTSLVPEVGRWLARDPEGRGAEWTGELRVRFPVWYLAYGDRWIGGENYTSPPHFASALFSGAVFVESLSFAELAAFLDVPWCRGDLFYLEKVAGALWAAGGRRWTRLEQVGAAQR